MRTPAELRRGVGNGTPSEVREAEELMDKAAAEIEQLQNGLAAAIRAAELALFVIRKQAVMPNSSWQSGFDNDLATAKAALGDGES